VPDNFWSPKKEAPLLYPSAYEVRAENLEAIVLGVLNLLRVGVAISSVGGRVLWANKAAERILSMADGLEVDANHFLRLSQPGSLFPIETILCASRNRLSWDAEHSIRCIPRPSGKRDLTVTVRPTTLSAHGQTNEKPAALLFIQDPAQPIRVYDTDLRQFYGLTSREGSMANLLMQGSTLAECCRELAIRPSTARMHLRNLLYKTGTRSQGELVWLLFRNHGFVGTLSAPEASIGVAHHPKSQQTFSRESEWD